MPAYPQSIFDRYRSKGILIDTNLMVLIAVGAYDPQRVLTFKRTLKYTLDDLVLMHRLLSYFVRRITTPNILTEVDNLTRQLPEAEYAAISVSIGQLVTNFFEVYIPSAGVIDNPNYPLLGLTDCVTAMAARDVLVVTDDFRLSNILAGLGCDAININHIRSQAWF
jgi:hypothetical protein